MKTNTLLFAGFSPQAALLFAPLARDLTGITRSQLFTLNDSPCHTPFCIIINGDCHPIAVYTYAHELRERYPRARILVIGIYALTPVCLQHLENYSVSVLAGAVSEYEIEECRLALQAGRIYRCREARAVLRAANRSRRIYAELSARERCVLILLLEGKSIKETASDMRLAAGTVSTYRHRALSKWQLFGRWNPYYIIPRWNAETEQPGEKKETAGAEFVTTAEYVSEPRNNVEKQYSAAMGIDN